MNEILKEIWPKWVEKKRKCSFYFLQTSEVGWKPLTGKPAVVCFCIIGSWWVNDVHSCIHSSALVKGKSNVKEENRAGAQQRNRHNIAIRILCHWHLIAGEATNKASFSRYLIRVLEKKNNNILVTSDLRDTVSHTNDFAYFLPKETGWCRAGPQSQLRGHAHSWTVPAGGKAAGWHPGLEPGHFLLWLWGRPGGRERGGEGWQ